MNDKEETKKFGLLPLMCSSSICELGAMAASSFSERINSSGNLLVTTKRTRLGNDVIKKLVTLRMNIDFMEYVHKHKHNVLKGISEAIDLDLYSNDDEDD